MSRHLELNPQHSKQAVALTAGRVQSVSLSSQHSFSKAQVERIHLIAGYGVEGDAHAGATVQHRSRWRRDPAQPNLRQVHLIQAELFAALLSAGFKLAPGDVGENITTGDIDLLGLPAGAQIHIGQEAVVEVTGLRNPCLQLDRLQPGLMQAVLDRDADGKLIRKAGIMGIVVAGGYVQPGDAIAVALPPTPFRPLGPV